MSSVALPAPGFADPTRDAQRTFRAVLDALARPARPYPLAGPAEPPAALGPGLAAVALTLLDEDTTVWLGGALGADPEVTAWIAFHTGARRLDGPADAAFVICDPDALPPLASLALGTDEAPHLSATVILDIRSSADAQHSSAAHDGEASHGNPSTHDDNPARSAAPPLRVVVSSNAGGRGRTADHGGEADHASAGNYADGPAAHNAPPQGYGTTSNTDGGNSTAADSPVFPQSTSTSTAANDNTGGQGRASAHDGEASHGNPSVHAGDPTALNAPPQCNGTTSNTDGGNSTAADSPVFPQSTSTSTAANDNTGGQGRASAHDGKADHASASSYRDGPAAHNAPPQGGGVTGNADGVHDGSAPRTGVQLTAVPLDAGPSGTEPLAAAHLAAARYVAARFVARGPGIDGAATLDAAWAPAGFGAAWRSNTGLFPRGVDLLLVSEDTVTGLPRTTVLTEVEP